MNIFPVADYFVSCIWGEGYNWVKLWVYSACMYLFLVSCSYGLQRWIDFPMSGAAWEPCVFQVAGYSSL